MTTVDTVITGVALYGLIFTTIFIIRWHRVTGGRWATTTPAGHVLMTASLVIGAFALLILANRAIPAWRDWWFKDWILVAVYFAIFNTPVAWLRLLRLANRTARKDSA